MSGYWAIGRLTSASSPIRTMTIEMTQAKTGRSMKNRANTAGLLLRLAGELQLGVLGRRGGGLRLGQGHLDEPGGDGDPAPDALDAVHHHLLARLQARQDLAHAVVQPAQLDGALVH